MQWVWKHYMSVKTGHLLSLIHSTITMSGIQFMVVSIRISTLLSLFHILWYIWCPLGSCWLFWLSLCRCRTTVTYSNHSSRALLSVIYMLLHPNEGCYYKKKTKRPITRLVIQQVFSYLWNYRVTCSDCNHRIINMQPSFDVTEASPLNWSFGSASKV